MGNDPGDVQREGEGAISRQLGMSPFWEPGFPSTRSTITVKAWISVWDSLCTCVLLIWYISWAKKRISRGYSNGVRERIFSREKKGKTQIHHMLSMSPCRASLGISASSPLTTLTLHLLMDALISLWICRSERLSNFLIECVSRRLEVVLRLLLLLALATILFGPFGCSRGALAPGSLLRSASRFSWCPARMGGWAAR